MDRSLRFFLNKFKQTPHSLRAVPHVNAPDDSCRCDLARLFHHYYVDTYGRCPPDPDPAHFEYARFLANRDDFRFAGDGIGVSTSARRNISTTFGQAFCRWFLHEHLNITYFAHMDAVLNRNLHRGFGNLSLVRTTKGDAPDYVCAEDVDEVFMAEAKGRYSSISFTNSEFATWRQQFSRVEVRDSRGQPRTVKGYIVGTRFTTEENTDSLRSAIYAEDPDSPGEEPLDSELAQTLRAAVVAQHYVSVFQKLDQSLIAAALASATTVPNQLQLQATVWELQLALPNMRFVGGYWPSPDGTLPFAIEDGRAIARPPDPFRLNAGRGTFFGVEESVFRQVAAVARFGLQRAADIRPLNDVAPFYSAISFLRDGTVIGPAEFFFPVDTISV
ncbi:MAG: hypothetical protein KDA87_26630 [Planctomycetales bacterium]|nr:hypothetical protein [Planctomycetales bacterium]